MAVVIAKGAVNASANTAKRSGQMHMAANTVMVCVTSVRPQKKRQVSNSAKPTTLAAQ
jgi:hypothetical protein